MSKPRYTQEFKDESVRQVLDRGYSVREVSSRVGASAHSPYKWVRAAHPDRAEEAGREATKLAHATLKA